MCGRFCLSDDAQSVIATFALTHNIVLKPRYNIAPNNLIPVIRTPGKLDFLTWGLHPVWLKEDQNPFINARVETLHEKPAFKHAFKTRRCLIIANGYYEWKQIGKSKQPYFISLPQNKLFAMAGIWEGETCAIITIKSQQQQISAVHDRMPLIIDPKFYDAWLNPKISVADLKSCTDNTHTVFSINAVSTKVNNPQHDFVECTFALQ